MIISAVRSASFPFVYSYSSICLDLFVVIFRVSGLSVLSVCLSFHLVISPISPPHPSFIRASLEFPSLFLISSSSFFFLIVSRQSNSGTRVRYPPSRSFLEHIRSSLLSFPLVSYHIVSSCLSLSLWPPFHHHHRVARGVVGWDWGTYAYIKTIHTVQPDRYAPYIHHI